MLIFVKIVNLNENSLKFILKFHNKEQSGIPTNISKPQKDIRVSHAQICVHLHLYPSKY